MRFVVSARRSPAAPGRDFLVDADPSVSTDDVIARMARELGVPPSSDVSVTRAARTQTLDAARLRAPLGSGDLLQGAELSFSGARPSDDRPSGLLELVTVRGPRVGSVDELGVGSQALGVTAGGGITTASGSHAPLALVTVGYDGRASVRLAPGVEPSRQMPIELESEPVTDHPLHWVPGAYLRIGETALMLRSAATSVGELTRTPEAATLDFNRPPAAPRRPRQHRFRLPKAPERGRGVSLPWIYAIAPLVFGIGMAVIMHRPYFLLFSLLTPISMLGNWLTHRRDGVKSFRQRAIEHRQELEALDRAIGAAVQEETAARRSQAPSPSDLYQAAMHSTRLLWERRAGAADFLTVRVGVGDLPSSIEVSDEQDFEFRRTASRMLRSVPVTVRVAQAGVVGLAMRDESARERELAWLVAQLAVLHLPVNLSLSILCARRDDDPWDWARWLPHVDRSGAPGPMTRIACGPEEVALLVAELSTVIAERRNAPDAAAAHAIVVVLDGARALRALPGVVQLLREGPALGVFCICADASVQQLPEECATVVSDGPTGGLRVREGDLDPVDASPDAVADDWFEPVARSLSALRDVSGTGDASQIPASSRLLPLLGLDEPAGVVVADRWSTNGRATRLAVGESFDGVFTLDLVSDGPHALVAGTTGSGKSEFLQTLVASAAVANRPDEMTFVLVDYKGGAAFAACSDLPHTVGFVTDLNTHLVQRALTSLRAELTRREHVLAGVAAKDIEDYQRAADRGGLPSLPRLLIVIDEFAALVGELPEFVEGLVNIAQRGRSLGVHLVLATQRPAGVVTADIRANTNLRVALRVTDASESADVIDVGDAASISKGTPGRAYARLGQSSVVPFQTSRVGGQHPIERDIAAVPPPAVVRLGVGAHRNAAPTFATAVADLDERTDLDLLVAAVADAASLAGIATPASPWLPPLGDVIVLDDIAPASPAPEGEVRPFAWGVIDRPRHQEQVAELFDLDEMTHLFVLGSPGSGRTQTLRTFVAAAARTNSPSDLHVYGLDCGSGGLGVLGELPHCGGIAGSAEPERMLRILDRLADEIDRRSAIIGAQHASGIAEQRAAATAADRLPHILFVLDRWESFTDTVAELLAGRPGELVTRILREGPTVGIHAIVSGDRSLSNSRTAQYAKMRGALRFDDPQDFTYLGFRTRDMPGEIAPGRLFWADRGAEEMQVAVLAPDVSGRAQAQAIRAIADDARARWPHPQRPVAQLRELPRVVTVPTMLRAPVERAHPLFATVGIGGDDARQLGADLSQVNTFLVAGPGGSGRTTLLTTMAQSLLARGSEIVVFSPRSSALVELDGQPGVRGVFTDAETDPNELHAALEPGDGPVVLVVDDGELLREAPAAPWMLHLVRTGRDGARAMIVAGELETIGAGYGRMWNLDVKRNRRGVLLSPASVYDGELIGVSLSRSQVSKRIALGDGLLHTGGGESVLVRVPRLA